VRRQIKHDQQLPVDARVVDEQSHNDHEGPAQKHTTNPKY
jgi:hypothetical protein